MLHIQDVAERTTWLSTAARLSHSDARVRVLPPCLLISCGEICMKSPISFAKAVMCFPQTVSVQGVSLTRRHQALRWILSTVILLGGKRCAEALYYPNGTWAGKTIFVLSSSLSACSHDDGHSCMTLDEEHSGRTFSSWTCWQVLATTCGFLARGGVRVSQ